MRITKMSDRHSVSPYPLRMPPELREHLEVSAKDGARSLHAEVIARLESTVALDEELASRSRGDLDHGSVLSWINYLEDEAVELRQELEDTRNNPTILDGGLLAAQVARSVVTPGMKAVTAFLAFQAAYPELVTDTHRQRVAIFAGRVADLNGEDPRQLIETLTENMLTAALEVDLGL